jgi:hypothetical protein
LRRRYHNRRSLLFFSDSGANLLEQRTLRYVDAVDVYVGSVEAQFIFVPKAFMSPFELATKTSSSVFFIFQLRFLKS